MNIELSMDLVICTYNNASLLDLTLKAISRQKVPPEVGWSVLVVNNNCTDETISVVDKHIKSGKIPSLSMVLEPKQGLTSARLCGVKNTTANWIAFVDDDCLLQEDWVLQAIRFASEHADCGAFGGRVVLDWQTPPPPWALNYGYSFAEQKLGVNPKQVSCLVGAGLIVNRSAIVNSGWTDKQFLADRVGKMLISGGDVEIALRIAANCDLWYNPKCKLKHVIPSARISKKYFRDINYGLGISKLLGDTMLWPGSFLTWLIASVIAALRSSFRIVPQALRAAIGRMEMIEVAINLSFLLGNWVGISTIIRMNAQTRRTLLGCASAAVRRVDFGE